MIKHKNDSIKEGIEEETQFKGPNNVFNKIMKEKLPNLKKEMSIKVQEA